MEWKDINNYIGYFQVSNLGDIKSCRRKVSRKLNTFHIKEESIKKQRLNKFGYLTVYLSINKKYRHFFVHRLVCENFVGPRPSEKHFVNHINGIKTDNRASNLEWVTVSENLKHAFRLGLMCQKGENHATLKLNNKKVLEIFNSSESVEYLANKYKVSAGTIRSIKNGISWSHLTGKIYIKKITLVKERVLAIFNSTERTGIVAKKFKTTDFTVLNIRSGRIWSNITGKTYEKKADKH